MRKPDFSIAKTKMQISCAFDHRLCFHYIDSTTPLRSKLEVTNSSQSSVAVEPGFCLTWSEILKTGVIMTHLLISR